LSVVAVETVYFFPWKSD